MQVQLITEGDEQSFGDCPHLPDLLEDPSEEVELGLGQTLLPRYLGSRDKATVLEVQSLEECLHEGVELLLEGSGVKGRGGFSSEDRALIVYARVVVVVGAWCPADCCHFSHIVFGLEAVGDEVGAFG